MNWKPRVSWGVLAVTVAIVAWLLTRWITHIDRNAHSMVEADFDERPPVRLDVANLTIGKFEAVRFGLPRVVIRSDQEVLFVVTPATHSITVTNVDPRTISCTFSDRALQSLSVAYMVEASEHTLMKPLDFVAIGPQTLTIRVPDTLRAALAPIPNSQGLIGCSSSREISAKPTFTERSITLRTRNGVYGSALFDVSALEDIDNLRFSGGVSLPLFGDRTRLLNGADSVVSAEWVDVTAAEQRDIVLVIIGALAAIAAAMAIEAIRPYVEREEQQIEAEMKKWDAPR